MQALFAYQFSKEDPNLVLGRLFEIFPERKKKSDFLEHLFHSVLSNAKWVDDIIRSHLQNWDFDRVAQLDRVLLRMGICEIYFMEDIPPKVSISEMVEIAKIYSTEESSGFINGILDAIYKEYLEKGKKLI
jgi:N utilization substance protein B